MSAQHYRFHSEWRIPAAPDVVFETLRDVESYPSWWPQVVRTRRIDEAAGEIHCRSLLPYELVFLARRDIEDPSGGILRAQLTGDLVGVSQWTITDDDGGALAVFDEDVEAAAPLLRRLGRIARPALRANHALMMRAGEQGLRRRLGGE